MTERQLRYNYKINGLGHLSWFSKTKRSVFCIFAMSFRVLFVIKCSTKISENSDIKKSRATYCFSGTYFKKQNLTTDGNQSKKIKMVAAVTTAAFAWHIS